MAVAIDDPQLTVGIGGIATLVDKAHVQARETAENRGFFHPRGQVALEPLERPHRPGASIGHACEYGVSLPRLERGADTPWHHPCRVDPFPPQPLDYLLPELTNGDAVSRQLWCPLRHAHDVAAHRFVVEAQ